MTTFTKTFKRFALVGIIALSATACQTTGVSSAAGIANQNLIEAQGRALNNDGKVIANENDRTMAVFNSVIAQGKLAEASGVSFDPQAAWAAAAERVDGARAQLTRPLLLEINRRLAKHNKKTVWVVN